MTGPAAPVVTCPNCGRAFDGRFCPDCGQEKTELRRPIRGLVRDLLSDAFAFDTRLWRTLPLLVTRPGRLAADYLAGRRARYVPPLRIYVFFAALFFAVMALTDGGPLRFVGNVQGRAVTIDSAFGVHLMLSGANGARAGSLAAGVYRAAEDVEGLNDVVIATLSYAHFLFLPLVALLLKSLWRHRWYVEHLVFGTYFFAFALLVGSLVITAYGVFGNPTPDGPAGRAAIGIWDGILLVALYPALKDMYGGRRIGAIARYLVLLAGCMMLASLVVVAVAVATIALIY